jgi:transcriptional regulator with GAF, ATPase, and Fis domain
MPAASAGGRVRGAGVKESAHRDEAVVQAAFLSESSPAFEDFLAGLSSAMSTVTSQNIQREIARWLDQLALQLGAEHCTVGEFYDAEEQPAFLLRWVVGNQPEPFLPKSRPWIQDQLAAGQVISIASLDELPAEDTATRALLEQMGIRSGIWIPMLAGGSGVGGMSLSMLSRDRAWTPQIVQRCRLVANVFANALLRLKRAAEIEERMEFEILATKISARYMNVEGDVDVLTDEVLAELGQVLEADRISYLEVNSEEDRLVPVLEWLRKGSAAVVSLQHVNVTERFAWLSAQIMRNEPIAIEHLDQFPDEARNEREYCEHDGIQSFIMVPATVRGVVVGAVALDDFDMPRIRDDFIINRLQILASMIVGAIYRERARQEIAELHHFEQVVSMVSTAFVNLPPEKVDDKIEKGLRVVAEALGADLVTLLQPRGRVGYDVTHESSSEGLRGHTFKGIRVEEVFPWLAGRLRNDETITISALSDFPAEAKNERAAMEQAGLESVVWVPFNMRGELAGHVAINTIRQRTWSKELLPRLKLLGEIFGEALSRRNAELELRESFKEINTLKEQLQQENLYLRQEVNLTHRADEIVGDSAAMRAVMEKAKQVAATDSTVLILGETGTGKELLARAIHNSSRRSAELMVTVNCAALPSSLVEAELFGREKGAYTGALSRELGRFEIADGSTILLDEIGELSLELQAKLLRVLQDGEFERLGSSKTLKVDARVLASTNRDLIKAVEDKEFREDLYYRLNVFPIELPPLRDRSDDIPQLVWTFVQEFSETMGKTIESISVASMNSMKAYRWPGNVREVRNIIERAMIVSQGPVLEIELPKSKAVGTGSSQKLAEVEREHILTVVESKGWRIRGEGGAAETLGLKPTTLEARMKKLGIERTPAK